VFISKQLLTDVNNLKVYIDGNQTDYTYGSTDNSWIINIIYEHSTHEVQMIIPEFPSIFVPALIIMSCLILLAVSKKKEEKTRKAHLRSSISGSSVSDD
jgi:hypothetical protein